MKKRKLAGFALLLSAVMLGAFISGCIDQGNATGTATTPGEKTSPTSTAPRGSTTETSTAPGTGTTTTPVKGNVEELQELVAEYETAIQEARNQLKKAGFEATGGDFALWDAKAEELKAMAGKETDPERKSDILYELAKLRYYQLLNLRTLAGIGAVERAYWENATTGEPIESFYNMRGEFFYTEKGRTVKMDSAKMAEKMHSLLKGYRIESVEIYHFGTGSVLRSIREGGRTVGAGQVAITINAKDGMKIKAGNGTDFETLRLVDPETGETVMKVAPDEEGIYTVPPVNTTLLGIIDGDFCYRPLPLDNHYLELMDVQDEPLDLDEAICSLNAQIAPFVFEPSDSDTGPFDPAPMEELYLMPGQYTVQTLVMKADLKQLAEQVVNINMRLGIEKNDIRRGMIAVADIRPEWTDGGGSSIQTPAETTCSCTFSPLLNGIFGETFGGEPFGEVPAIKDINITDFGNGPFIPELWKGFEDYGAVVKIYGITSSDGETLILIGDPGNNRLSPSYLDRVFLEIYTGRNPQTGKEIKIAAFKILNTDGTIAARDTYILPTKGLRIVIVPLGTSEGKLSNSESASER